MADTLEYRGYRGTVEFSAEDRVFHGKIHGIQDSVSFEGESIDDLEQGFREAVDDYLEFCTELGKQPDRAYSGRIPLRISEELHRAIAVHAESEGSSLNAWIAARLRELADQNAA